MNQSTAVAPTSWLHKDSPTRKLLGGAIGNMGEQFDYSIYAFTAPIIALNFFPSSNPVAALLNTFVVYALSFVARPFGGVMFGYIGDRFGRLAVLTWTVVLMGVGTMLIGLLPSYSSVGVLAPILLVVCRLLQGLSLGGETTGVESYIAESAPDGKRASWTSLVMSFAYIPVALVACFILGLRTVMGDAAFEAWGWRIPFLLGGVVAFAGYLLRRNLDDPDEYLEAKAEADQLALVPKSGESVAHALGQSFKTRKSMLLVILLLAPQSVAAYLLTGYMYTYLVKEGHTTATSHCFRTPPLWSSWRFFCRSWVDSAIVSDANACTRQALPGCSSVRIRHFSWQVREASPAPSLDSSSSPSVSPFIHQRCSSA